MEGKKAYKVAREGYTKRFGKGEVSPVDPEISADTEDGVEMTESAAPPAATLDNLDALPESGLAPLPTPPPRVAMGRGGVDLTNPTFTGTDPGDIGALADRTEIGGAENLASYAQRKLGSVADGFEAVRGKLGSVGDGFEAVRGKLGTVADGVGAVGERLLPAAGTGLAGYEAGDDVAETLGASKKASKAIGIGLGTAEGIAALAVPEAAPFILGADLLGDTLFDLFKKHKPKVPQPPKAPMPVNPLQQGNIAIPTLTTSAQ